MMGEEEKAGSTRIIEILPEGSKVKAGDIVAKLDSSALEDEAQAQEIRYLQAKSYVEQAKSIYEVNLITLKEYRDGILPSDMQLVRQYIETRQLEKNRLERNVAWSEDMNKKGFRTRFQVRGDTLAYEQSVIALKEAEGMLTRLKDQTGPKNLKALEANVRAIQSDMLTQDAAFETGEATAGANSEKHRVLHGRGAGRWYCCLRQSGRLERPSHDPDRSRRRASPGPADLQFARPQAHASQGEGQ